mgnify:CR=1 FL=1
MIKKKSNTLVDITEIFNGILWKNMKNLNTILSTTKRAPFQKKDLHVIEDYINVSNKKGYDISLDPMFNNNPASFKGALDNGFIILRSNKLNICFMLVNVNKRKGLFGRQKKQRRKIVSFMGAPMDFMFTQNYMANDLIVALTEINTVFIYHMKKN